MSDNTNISNAYHAIEVCEPSIRPDHIELRKEQKDAVKDAKKRFRDWTPDKETKFLWNAKMRFGKTVSALQLAKEMGELEENPVHRTIIVTHRPVVEDSWRDDFDNIFSEEERRNIDFATKFDGDNNDISALINKADRGLVFFASMQYLRGSALVGGKRPSVTKDLILNAPWDLVVVDEAHEGTLTDLGAGVIDYLTGGKKRRLLSLSGTPFNLFENFAKSEIFTWDYVQEQEAKLQWPKDNPDKPEAANPYRTLPKMEIRILEPEKVMQRNWADGFKLSDFFRIDDSKEARRKLREQLDAWKALPKNQRGPKPTYRFIHEKEVIDFLSRLADDSDPANSYPFANPVSRAQLRHSFWVLPGVKECQAMKYLLDTHPDYRERDEQGRVQLNGYKVINVAGTREGDEERANALDSVKNAINDLQGTGIGTITLSCGRLTTGVTVPQWTAVLYLKGSTSTKASTYMQTIFRVQSPWEFLDPATGDNLMKTTCYVFDFDPTRALTNIAETAKYSALSIDKRANARAQTVDDDTRENLSKFLQYLQVCDMSGEMIERDTATLVRRLVENLHSVAIERAVQSGFDNQSIYNVREILSAPVEDMEEVRDVVGETDPEAKKPKNKPTNTRLDMSTVSRNGGTPGENAGRQVGKGEEETPEQRAAKEAAKRLNEEKKRRVAILRGIAIRIPLMMFGADGNSESTITLDNITNPRVVDDRSWAEFMPKGVTRELFKKLKKYFDREVFDGAGRRYRELTREADFLPITERVARIAEIQSWFRNPNSETVLTPWKVVNRHLSDTIGGYCFFNESFTGKNLVEVEPEPGSGKLFDYEETNEPRFVDRGEITERVFRVADDDHSTLLEINSKSGLYPLYLVYTLYRRRMEQYLQAELIDDEAELSLEEQQVIWDDAVSLCLHIICNTPMAEYITRRTLLGFRQCKNEKDKAIFESEHPGLIGFLRSNLKIRHLDLVEQARDCNLRPELVAILRNPKFWSNNPKTTEPMKFDAVVGNPPYMETSATNNRQNPIYHNFYDLAEMLGEFYTLISPARFLFNGGLTPADWNRKMLSDIHLKVAEYIQDAKQCFPSANINGGVAIVIWDKNADYQPINSFIPDNTMRSIASKFRHDESKNMTSIVFAGRSDLKFNEKFLEDYPQSVEDRLRYIQKTRPSVECLGPNEEYELKTAAFEALPYAFLDEVEDDNSFYRILGLEQGKRVWKYISKKYMTPRYPDRNNINKYKIFISKADGAAGVVGKPIPARVIGRSVIGKPDDSATTTFIGIGAFDSLTEAINCGIYLKTKLLRCLLCLIKTTQDNPPSIWAYVPLQDFTANSDVPWEKSIEEIDRYLYQKYGLDDEEIAFIEKMIKPMSD